MIVDLDLLVELGVDLANEIHDFRHERRQLVVRADFEDVLGEVKKGRKRLIYLWIAGYGGHLSFGSFSDADCDVARALVGSDSPHDGVQRGGRICFLG